MYDKTGKNVVGRKSDDQLEENADASSNTNPDPNQQAPIIIAADIAELILSEDGTLLATDTDGNAITAELPALPEEGKTLVIQDKDGEQWTVDANGGITKGAVGGTGSEVTPPEAAGADEDFNYTITFAPDANQTYGFDDTRYDQSNKKTLNETDYWVAWKSIASGRTDYAIATTDKENFPAYIGFKTPIAPLSAQQGDKENTKRVSIIGTTHGDTQQLKAYAIQKRKAVKALKTIKKLRRKK